MLRNLTNNEMQTKDVAINIKSEWRKRFLAILTTVAICISLLQGVMTADTDNDLSTEIKYGKDASNIYMSVEKIQRKNLELLADSLPQGWQAFCDAAVDEGVMSLFNGINPSDAIIHVMTLNNQSVELPIKSLSELRDFDINPERKTLIYVNGYYTPESYFSVQSHLKMLQVTRRDLNVILIDFSKDLQQLYYAVRHHLMLQGYFIAKILSVLIANGLAPKDITLAGHSVGANIGALGATLYAAQTETDTEPQGTLIGQLIAIDPARMCQASDIYVRKNISSRVVVIHGESEVFGVHGPLGTIDIFPNGIGAIPRKKNQPGCDTPLCNHMYPFVLFMEALIEGVIIPAVKCDSWLQFRRTSCDHNNIISIGIQYPERAAGSYFCMTQPNPPFTYMEHGLRFKKIA